MHAETDHPDEEPRAEDHVGNEAASSETAPESTGKRETAESGGPKGLEPTRYGDWERKGRCIDF